jgi:hypothetical protein
VDELELFQAIPARREVHPAPDHQRRWVRPKLYGTGENVHDWTHVEDHNFAVRVIIVRDGPARRT